jgi:hypothetical protein
VRARRRRHQGSVSTDRLTLDWIRTRGWVGDLVERRVSFARRGKRSGVSRDFLGFADIVALEPGGRAVAIQHTSASNFASRRRKVLGSPEAACWAYAGGRVLVLGWRPKGADVRIEDLTARLRGETDHLPHTCCGANPCEECRP